MALITQIYHDTRSTECQICICHLLQHFDCRITANGLRCNNYTADREHNHLPKCRSPLKILGSKSLTRSKSHTEHPEALGDTVRNLVAQELWPLRRTIKRKPAHFKMIHSSEITLTLTVTQRNIGRKMSFLSNERWNKGNTSQTWRVRRWPKTHKAPVPSIIARDIHRQSVRPTDVHTSFIHCYQFSCICRLSHDSNTFVHTPNEGPPTTTYFPIWWQLRQTNAPKWNVVSDCQIQSNK